MPGMNLFICRYNADHHKSSIKFSKGRTRSKKNSKNRNKRNKNKRNKNKKNKNKKNKNKNNMKTNVSDCETSI